MKITLKEVRNLVKEEVAESMLDRAIALATRLHAGQKDKGGKDYIDHPLRVMKTVQAAGCAQEAAIAAVLHDTVEDTDLTIEDVRTEFGPRVGAIVELLSKKPGETYAQFIDRIIASGNRDAMQVKLADLTDNRDVSRLGKEPDERNLSLLNRYEKAYKKISDALENTQ